MKDREGDEKPMGVGIGELRQMMEPGAHERCRQKSGAGGTPQVSDLLSVGWKRGTSLH